MTGLRRAFVCALVATALVAARAAAGASRQVAYCPLTASAASVSWAFHAGTPIQAATGSYAHGSGSLSGDVATGRICQVDRVRASMDRQIQLSVAHGRAVLQRGISMDGVRGAQLQLPVRVATSTDPRCSAGTAGKVTLFSSYNGVHQDFARFAFPSACRYHDHQYRGSGVAVSLPS